MERSATRQSDVDEPELLDDGADDGVDAVFDDVLDDVLDDDDESDELDDVESAAGVLVVELEDFDEPERLSVL